MGCVPSAVRVCKTNVGSGLKLFPRELWKTPQWTSQLKWSAHLIFHPMATRRWISCIFIWARYGTPKKDTPGFEELFRGAGRVPVRISGSCPCCGVAGFYTHERRINIFSCYAGVFLRISFLPGRLVALFLSLYCSAPTNSNSVVRQRCDWREGRRCDCLLC